MESIAEVVVVVDPADAEVERASLGQEVLAVQTARLAELEAKTKCLVGLEALRAAAAAATMLTIITLPFTALAARPGALLTMVAFAALPVGVIAIAAFAALLVRLAIATRLVRIAALLVRVAIAGLLVRVVPLPGVGLLRCLRVDPLLAVLQLFVGPALQEPLLAVLQLFVGLALQARVTLGLRLCLSALDVRGLILRESERGTNDERTNTGHTRQCDLGSMVSNQAQSSTGSGSSNGVPSAHARYFSAHSWLAFRSATHLLRRSASTRRSSIVHTLSPFAQSSFS